MAKKNWQGKNILILGAARQGQALARYLAGAGAQVTVNDKQAVEKIGSSVQALESLGIKFVLGSHPLSLLDKAEIVCLSGGIPLNLPIVQSAVERGLMLTNDSQIFMEEVKAPVIGITGSAGKTTTTTLVGRIAEKSVQAPNKAWVGGNIGLPLVEYLDEIKKEDTVILELSSFQLEQMTLSPQVAAVLNITPNHLDRHGTMEAYAAAKARILEFQHRDEWAILSREDKGSSALAPMVKSRLASFGWEHSPQLENGAYVEDGFVCLKWNSVQTKVMDVKDVALRGTHNLLNVLAAVTICAAAGMTPEAMREGIRGFGGVEHRLEIVRQWQGITWVNDSIATAPERASAALDSFNEPIILLLGGRDKDLPWQDLAAKAHRRVSQVILFGEATEKIAAALGNPLPGEVLQKVHKATNFANALEIAASAAKAGDVVLLSPGCTSYDAFKDFEERGNYFKNWVKELK